MINYSRLFVLLWSPSQKCFHYETLDRTMETGVETYFSDDRPQDYIVLAVGESREEVMAIRAELAAKKEEDEESEQAASQQPLPAALFP
jgi:DNA-binding NarL/FixJ family response regulator